MDLIIKYSHNMIMSGCMYFPSNDNVFFRSGKHSAVWMNHLFGTHSSISGHLAGSRVHNLCIVTSVAITMT